MEFIEIEQENEQAIEELSAFASAIVKEVFDPLIGAAQNDYMIQMFQSKDSIKRQLAEGYQYYNVIQNGEKIGFLALYEKPDNLYLSKFYLEQHYRRHGYSKEMFRFVCEQARERGFHAVTLNVNKQNPARFVYEKLGMTIIGKEKNDIGNGYYMDDYVYGIQI